ncbi:MAG: metallophosphoesterase [Nanoarchaeota archaeon]|nr:metallophosphoesterase [Nanoarchaeota archaeon]
MIFAHMGDCHIGSWRQPQLMALNFQSFQVVVDRCIKEKVDFILIAGDFFDSAYPPIEVIKETFGEFRKLKNANIPVFFIAGSHDFSASGKTFLDVLEKAGFGTNVFRSEERDGRIILQPTIYKNIAIYGYPGKKSGMEVPEIEKIKLQDSPGLFKILMLHTAIRDAVGTLPIQAVDQEKLPEVDYTALAHLHIKYNKNRRVYCGPTFPNNSLELEELRGGSFYLIDTTTGKIERQEIKLKEVIVIDLELTDAFIGTEKVIEELKKHILKDKIIILKLRGILERGKVSDINFNHIEEFTRTQEAYVLLRNTTKLQAPQTEISFELKSENIEEEIISKFREENPNKFNELIFQLISALQLEKKEDERTQIFEDRLLSEVRKIIKI